MTHSQPESSSPAQTVRLLQIITLALVTGLLLLAGIAVIVTEGLTKPSEGVLVSGLGAAFAVVAFVMHLVMPAIVARQQLKTVRGDGLYGVYQQKTIMGLAILEGAAFFNLVAVLLEHNAWSLAIAGGLAFWMLAMFPTQTRVDHWVETRRLEGES